MAAILDGFGSGGTRILIGTQMLGRGLDFKGDGLVGILNADGWMSFPDFRAHERAYQQMSQVLGRAGLGDGRCEVVLQTGRPEHPVIRAVLEQDYEGLFRLQMEERALFHYPPLFRLVEITMRHREEKVLGAFANAYAGDLREGLGDRVLGPDRPAVGRVQGRFIRKILLKIERLASAAEWKGMVEAARGRCTAAFGPVAVQYEVV
jgi:primosomal protein N' (replication factor Y)